MSKTCTIVEFNEVCGKRIAGLNMCSTHYYLFKKTGDPTKRAKAPPTGRSKDPLYNAWFHMHERCYYEDNNNYHNYGARGIKVCDRWNRSVNGWVGFDNFRDDVGPRPEGTYPSGKAIYSIDRIDNDGDYEPSNVKWSTSLEQNINQRRNKMYKKNKESK